MDKKGIYIEISKEDNEYLDIISKNTKKISKVSIIRGFLNAIRGLDKDCCIIALDKNKIRMIEGFKVFTDIDKEYSEYNLEIFYRNGSVETNGFCIKHFGGEVL